jgi:hypothetical protein
LPVYNHGAWLLIQQQEEGYTYARETLFEKLSIYEIVQRTFNRSYTRNSLIIYFWSVTALLFLLIVDVFTLHSVANDGVLGFDQLLMLNFKRRELKYGKFTRKIEAGLSNEEYAKIWMHLVIWM